MIRGIQLSGIRRMTRCGCLPGERIHPTELHLAIRLEMELELGDSPAEDDLENTLDYRVVLDTLDRVIAERHFALVESLAETAARRIRDLHPAIRAVEVEIAKPGALPDQVVPTILARA